jgi:uncharacterized membrane protein
MKALALIVGILAGSIIGGVLGLLLGLGAIALPSSGPMIALAQHTSFAQALAAEIDGGGD